MSAPPLATGLPPGTRLGPYEVVAPLSAGGMATLYLGRRTGPAGFSRYVAIKVVHQHMARDPGFVSMFLDEARLAARIEHPNVVHTEELGEERGTHYIAMEYLRGCSLGQFLQKLAAEHRGLSPELCAYIAMKVADGLHTAHELKGDDGQSLGVVHRDVSPQNVFLTYDGQVKLIDFGVAKVRGRDRGTLMGSLKGKIRYMSPEQASSQPVDRRTDVYALGIVLWECLTHQRLFSSGDDMEALARVKNPHIASPSALAPSIGPGLDECVMTALAREPDRRFQTALAFRRAIGGGCPAALEVDAETLAALLVSVMHDDIERERREVPALADAIVVKAPTPELTRGGRALTRQTPVVSEAAVRASADAGARASLAARGSLPVAAQSPLGTWRPATIALVALGATSLGVALAWAIASQLARPAAGSAALPVAAGPAATPIVPLGTAEPVMAPSTAAVGVPAIPNGAEPPNLVDETAGDWDDEERDDSEGTPTHRTGHRTGHADPSDYPAPPPPYRSGDPYAANAEPSPYREPAPYREPPPPEWREPPPPGPGPGYEERPPPPPFGERPGLREPLPPPRGPEPGLRPPVDRTNTR